VALQPRLVDSRQRSRKSGLTIHTSNADRRLHVVVFCTHRDASFGPNPSKVKMTQTSFPEDAGSFLIHCMPAPARSSMPQRPSSASTFTSTSSMGICPKMGSCNPTSISVSISTAKPVHDGVSSEITPPGPTCAPETSYHPRPLDLEAAARHSSFQTRATLLTLHSCCHPRWRFTRCVSRS
jgi:hypothetical protein